MLISLNNTKVNASVKAIHQPVYVVYSSFQSWLLKFTHTGKKNKYIQIQLAILSLSF